jgi:3-hydroxyisobutyrate dehydrogenase
MIAFFGTGLVGSGFVRALRRRGETVHVYNRTLEKARALEADGAVVFEDPAAAAKGADRIHLSLSDDAAVDDVLARALPGLGPKAMILDHTTTSPTGTKERAVRWNEGGRTFVHAPVFMGPQNALESTGLMLVSGEPARVQRAIPLLEPMTGKVIPLGVRPEAAAAFKLFGNLFLMFFTGGLAEVFALARATGIEPRDAASLFEHYNPGKAISGRVERMLDGDPSKVSWELGMARKDARLMLEAAAEAGVSLPMLPAIAARMDALIAAGHGKSDWTILGQPDH